MVPFNRSRRVVAALATVALLAGASFASAQEISEAHLKAARAAVTSIKATDSMDSILPQANQMLKIELIQKNPNLEEDIVRIVDEETLAIAPRRGDLEKEVATAFAKAFTEQELTEIAAFHNSPTGKKFLSDSPIVGREVSKAVDIWQLGIARDLSQAVAKKLAEVAPAAQPPAPVEAPPANGQAPASPTLTPPAQ
ncbi:DUF2059 domain-containing protein [Mesorhizobium australicum]|uniref:DUF2059 domain-containing protein n=1 Tax=Mesorhizobium australicum TaxID=536018 RepID=A0A1X7P2R0_9HYPH|nr:DUF2059 domain-containing protein [Mesorhizobium australicum]SMH45101.1 hypothetical protein SAMN02982922_3133 [Mesorhizobium australicum]